jgi:hypothetical protein
MSEQFGVTPEADARMRTAVDSVTTKLAEWGAMRVLHGTALALVVLGGILPIVTVSTFGLFSSSSSSVHLPQFGMGGWLVVLVGVALGGAPFALTIPRRMATIGYGLACATFGVLLVPYFISGFTGQLAQLSFGYYSLAAAFGILLAAYWRRLFVVAAA